MSLNDFRQMIAHAVRAPSGHNTQPWLFTVGSDHITISPDPGRRLPVVDPDDRELFISLGCAAENLRIAASHQGYTCSPRVSDAGEIVISLTRQDGVTPDPLFEQIPHRQTNRATYDGRSISQTLLASIIAATQTSRVHIRTWTHGTPEHARLTERVLAGNTAQMKDTPFKQELLSWIRYNRSHSKRTRDGLSYAVMGAPSLPEWISRPIIRFSLHGEILNTAERKRIASSSHLMLLSTGGDTRPDWIETGSVLQRTLLLLTQHGIAHAYLNQPCEVPFLRERIGVGFSAHNRYPQILMRLGYAKPRPYSERRAVDEVIREA